MTRSTRTDTTLRARHPDVFRVREFKAVCEVTGYHLARGNDGESLTTLAIHGSFLCCFARVNSDKRHIPRRFFHFYSPKKSMGDPVLDNLLALANAYTMTQSLDPSGESLVLTLATPGGQSLPALVDTITQTIVQNSPVDLSLLLKNVRFATAPVTDNAPVGGLPILDLLTPGIVETDGSGKPTPGVGGILATITGAIPLLVSTLVQNSLSVTVLVHWQIRDENGNPVSDVTTFLGASATPTQAADIFPPPGQELAPLIVSLLPTVVELTNQLPPAANRAISVSINLMAMSGSTLRATTGWITLPPISIQLPTLPIPTLAVFFSNIMSGHALVAVPANSPLTSSAELFSALNTLLGLLSSPAVSALGFIASSLTGGLTTLITNLNKCRGVYFKSADGVGNLSTLELQHSSWSDPTGMNADDDLSSLIYMAAPVRNLQCFNDSGFKDDEGEFTVSTSLTDGLFTTIKSFKAKTMAAEPASGLTIDKPPGGFNARLGHHVSSFNDELSSYRFILKAPPAPAGPAHRVLRTRAKVALTASVPRGLRSPSR